MRLKFAFIVLCVLVSCRLWSFHGFPDQVFNFLEVFTAATLLIIALSGYHHIPKNILFKRNVFLFILLPVLSVFGASVFHDQQPLLSLSFFRANLFWLLYPVLHIYRVPVKFLIRLILVIGCVWIIITVVQQFTYPVFYFYVRNGEEEYDSLYRAGVYRFMLDPKNYALFIIFYFYYKFLSSNKLKNIIPVLAGLVGFYYFGTRQYMGAALFCLFIASLMQPGKQRMYAIFSISLIFIVLFYYKDVLFGTYIEMTTDQLNAGDDIRLQSAKFFLFEYWPSWTAFITGNGQEHINSAYGQEMIRINTTLGYYRGDVGIIGALNTFGILYALNILSVTVKGVRSRYYSDKTSHLRLLFINFLILLPLSEEYSYQSSIAFFCIVFYLVDQSFIDRQLNHSFTINQL